MSDAFERLLAAPWGPHDPDVAALALALRSGPAAGRLALVARPDGQYALARLPAAFPGDVDLLGPVYDSVIDGERDILRRRHEGRR